MTTARGLLYYEFHKVFRSKKRPLLKQVKFRGAEFLVLANEDVGKRLLGFREYERSELEALEQLVREEDLCVDVGANIGIFSIFMARKANRGRVFAFEPVQFNRSILDVNMALNGTTNVDIRNCVLGSTPGTAKFSVSEDSAYSSLRPTNVKKEALSLDVQVETLDNLFASGGQRVDVVKIDVEGAELMVLKGGEKLLSTPELRPRALLIELSEQNQSVYGDGPRDVVAYLQEKGYKVYSITEGGLKRGWPLAGAANALFVPEGEAVHEISS